MDYLSEELRRAAPAIRRSQNYVRTQHGRPASASNPVRAADIDRIWSLRSHRLGGNDTITTGDRNDIIIGGTGNDVIFDRLRQQLRRRRQRQADRRQRR